METQKNEAYYTQNKCICIREIGKASSIVHNNRKVSLFFWVGITTKKWKKIHSIEKALILNIIFESAEKTRLKIIFQRKPLDEAQTVVAVCTPFNLKRTKYFV